MFAAFHPPTYMFVNYDIKLNMHLYMNILNLYALLYTVKSKIIYISLHT